MYLVLSGEGRSDVGYCDNSIGYCEADKFYPRAMAIIIDQIIDKWYYKKRHYNHSFLFNQQVTYISEAYLAGIKTPQEKKMAFPGKKKPQETKYFYENARSLAIFAKEKQDGFSDRRKVIAILFRDADGTASSGRGEYKFKRSSIQKGFEKEDFSYGVAMIPKPKSEAWLLCAIKNNPYQSCDALEDASGNDNSPNSLKDQFAHALNSYSPMSNPEDLLNDNKIDIDQIKMPSFLDFRNELESILEML